MNKYVFQFHYGTIKIHLGYNGTYHKRLFQFHYGTIKILYGDDVYAAVFEFQFHYGTIKIIEENVHIPAIVISIPLWYD